MESFVNDNDNSYKKNQQRMSTTSRKINNECQTSRQRRQKQRSVEKNGKENYNQPNKTRGSNKRKTVIIGDSMLKGVQAWKLKKHLKENIKVKSFSGATIEDMNHYVIPSKKEEPNVFIIHAGTNNLKDNKSSEELANEIMELGKSLSTPRNDVAISGICHRADGNEERIFEINEHLKRNCSDGKLFYIDNDNILSNRHLNMSGLHLNARGNSLLANNFINCLKY